MRRYPSKLLLFGEHILLLGARALAMPVPAFGGQWAWSPAGAAPDAWAGRLREFAGSSLLTAIPGLDTARFAPDLERGLFFKSNIPVGYGLGSSGALCAAVYDRYAEPKTEDLGELKRLLAGMERFFHGQSSGIDPLTSYLNRALWISNKTDVHFFEPPAWQTPEPVVFLLDSRLPRRSEPLIQWFLEQSLEPAFYRLLERELFPAHETMLDAWQTGVSDRFWPALRRVSAFQLEHLAPMIPATLRAQWTACLASEDVLLKVCGAGGGGFVLGFASSKNTVFEKFSTFAPVFPFDEHALVEK